MTIGLTYCVTDSDSPSYSSSDRRSDGSSSTYVYSGSQDRHDDSRSRPQARNGPPPSPTVGPLVLLAPLAGLAALYAMAYVNTNPALLTIASISGRKKRAVERLVWPGSESFEGASQDNEDEDEGWLQEIGTLTR